MSNLAIYNAVREVPQDAQKSIQAGRLKGKTDINPMWRIKALTEQFGACGFGWKYVITKQWLEAGANDEVSAFCNIDLYIKVGGEWSAAIPGTGGSAFITNERNGLYMSDECYKMALTDAISVACKALGFGADIYWSADRTKYEKPAATPAKAVVDAALFPGGERFVKAVAMHATGAKTGPKSARDLWAAKVHADSDLLSAFDQAVADYKIQNNIQ